MAFAVNNPILASDFISLKQRVKAECQRRKYNGSVASYASSAYDYSVQPSEDNPPTPEHFNKIIEPLNAISTNYTQTRTGYIVRSLQAAGQLLTNLESIPLDAESSGCKASCTGLCQGTCTGSCKSGCTGSCTGGCGSACGGVCSNSCFSNCDNYCTNTCDEVCAFSCSADCEGACEGTCSGGCIGFCKGTCKGDSTYYPAD